MPRFTQIYYLASVIHNWLKKIEIYNELRLVCSKIFLFHLGDESGTYDLSKVYKNCDYVWRTFCSNKYFKNNQVRCIPIGYKSGLANKQENKRKYKWAFTGTPHKSSRHDLLFQFSDIKWTFSKISSAYGASIMAGKLYDMDVKVSDILKGQALAAT